MSVSYNASRIIRPSSCVHYQNGTYGKDCRACEIRESRYSGRDNRARQIITISASDLDESLCIDQPDA